MQTNLLIRISTIWTVLLTASIALADGSAESQKRTPNSRNPIDLGVEIAGTQAGFGAYGTLTPENINTFDIGILGIVELSENIAFQSGLTYQNRGADIRGGVPDPDTYRTIYLSLPILARLYYPLTSHWEISLPLGGSLRYLISSKLGGNDIAVINRLDVSAVAGLGVRYQFMANWSATLDLRYEQGLRDVRGNVSNVTTRNHAFILSLSLSRSFRRDSDGDGIPNSRDSCWTSPEDFDGVLDSDGCPGDDEDRDGIKDDDDECKDEAEDKDGVGDDDGCPEEDYDKDGRKDADDACPNSPADTANGCPDTDGDGVMDNSDKCPNDGSSLGVRKDGCPIYTHVKDLTTTEIVLYKPIQFESGRSKLTSLNKKKLDEMAEILNLKKYEHHHILVRGHADPTRKAAKDTDKDINESLSKQRARVVRKYLADKIEGSRLKKIGCSNRLASGTGAAWKDRSVDFQIIAADAPKPSVSKNCK